MKKWLVLISFATVASAAFAGSPVEDERRLDCLVTCLGFGIEGGTCSYICNG
jgi:hypothetical protein